MSGGGRIGGLKKLGGGEKIHEGVVKHSEFNEQNGTGGAIKNAGGPVYLSLEPDSEETHPSRNFQWPLMESLDASICPLN